VEERRGARRLTQRQLGESRAPAEEPRPAPSNDPPAASPPVPVPPPESLAVLREPSDVHLRERQRLWWQERTRFEASKAARRSRGDDSK
jgi:hypothetical protein